MELIDTPNPNAKKILFKGETEKITLSIEKVEGISSVFVGPGFLTITKESSSNWEIITEDIVNIFDKL